MVTCLFEVGLFGICLREFYAIYMPLSFLPGAFCGVVDRRSERRRNLHEL